MGEINLNDEFGAAILDTIKKYKINKILEIGSWDGTGSTKCFIEALRSIEGASLTCLEVREERFNQLIKNTEPYAFVDCYNKSTISQKTFLNKNFDEIWNSKYNKIRNTSRNIAESWYNEDMNLLSKTSVGFLEENNDSYDGVLIDGGEFYGYSEYNLLKNRCKAFFLDDCVYGFKNRQVGEELEASPDWELIAGSKAVRNGFAIFIKKDLEER
jgi:hypothetical protein